MHQPAPSPDSDDVHRKAKLLALLDRARANCGLHPERNGSAVDAMDASSPIKAEPTDSTIKCEVLSTASTSHFPEHQTLMIRHKSSSAATMASDAHNPAQMNFSNCSGTSGSGANKAVGLPRTNLEPSASSQTEEIKSEVNLDAHHAVAGLNSTPKPRIADLTGNRERVPRLPQLKPLGVPRNNAHQPQLEFHEEKHEMPPRTQTKPPRKNTPPNSTVTLNTLELLTPDEYEDSELHSDFQHMLHILIPSNATTALLERRGEPIQSINQQTDCTLSIREPDASPFKDDRLLRIYGKAKGISLAQRLVIAYIRAYRAKKRDPNYMDLSGETLLVALPVTSITKAMSVAVTCGKKNELEITSPFHWMIQREHVGKTIGRQGSILAAIRHDTGAAIHIEEDVVPGTTERRVVLTGPEDSIAAAIEEIKDRSGGRPEMSTSTASARLGQYFAIPYHAAGFLIGPQGSTIKSITERTEARLQIPSAEDLPLGSVNRIIHMQGNPKQAEHAIRVVGAKLRDYLASPKCPRTLLPSSTGRKGDKVTIKVLLPSRICGFMLDQRGKLIREISEKSGAFTYFLTPHDDDSRVCAFTGDMSSVLRAQRLVLQVIAGDAISSKRIVPTRKRKRSQREVQEVRYPESVEEDDYVEDDEPFYENDVQGNLYDDEYEETLSRPICRHTILRQPPRRRHHDYEVDEDMRRYNDDVDEVKYEKRPRQRFRRRRVAIRSRDGFDDEYDIDNSGREDCAYNTIDEYGHDEYANEYGHDGYTNKEYDDEDQVSYDVPRPRLSKRLVIVRRQPIRRRRDDYDYEEYDDEFTYSDSTSDNDYEAPIARKQLIKRRAVVPTLYFLVEKCKWLRQGQDLVRGVLG
ncbi:hypothetical protein PHMEG_00016580 [Phytophthora megakarya]|uniref:K Homology domain-containing protein n=1 Tax=Phytophthora megakarya TaxID=4795 RepID=A0A225W0J6_9STRA|nr:hypothetical protein PHMEG_00016580 [Phytophthora megakarya]